MLSDFYDTCPSEETLGAFLGQPTNQRWLLDEGQARQAVHATASEHVVRFEVALDVPAHLEAEQRLEGTRMHLRDLIAPDHPLYEPLVHERHRHAVFLTDLAVQGGTNPFRFNTLGVRTNLVSLPLWGFGPDNQDPVEDDVQQSVADAMGRQCFLFDQGYVYALRSGQHVEDGDVPPQMVRSASRKERVGLYTYGGRISDMPNNVARLRQGVVQLPLHPAWSVIETSHALYGQLIDYQKAHRNKAYLEYCEAQEAEEDGGKEALAQTAWLEQEHPRELDVPLTFRLGATGVPEEQRTEFAVVPTALLEQFCREAGSKLFYYLLQELPFEKATLAIEPIGKTWAELYAGEAAKGGGGEEEETTKTIRLVLDMKLVLWEREQLAASVCREIPVDPAAIEQEKKEHEELARKLGAVAL